MAISYELCDDVWCQSESTEQRSIQFRCGPWEWGGSLPRHHSRQVHPKAWAAAGRNSVPVSSCKIQDISAIRKHKFSWYYAVHILKYISKYTSIKVTSNPMIHTDECCSVSYIQLCSYSKQWSTMNAASGWPQGTITCSTDAVSSSPGHCQATYPVRMPTKASDCLWKACCKAGMSSFEKMFEEGDQRWCCTHWKDQNSNASVSVNSWRRTSPVSRSQRIMLRSKLPLMPRLCCQSSNRLHKVGSMWVQSIYSFALALSFPTRKPFSSPSRLVKTWAFGGLKFLLFLSRAGCNSWRTDGTNAQFWN